tara:strand:- start:399 stop:557 length:159 start_codon:yes stop_codon:yes gene_type:complete
LGAGDKVSLKLVEIINFEKIVVGLMGVVCSFKVVGGEITKSMLTPDIIGGIS